MQMYALSQLSKEVRSSRFWHQVHHLSFSNFVLLEQLVELVHSSYDSAGYLVCAPTALPPTLRQDPFSCCSVSTTELQRDHSPSKVVLDPKVLQLCFRFSCSSDHLRLFVKVRLLYWRTVGKIQRAAHPRSICLFLILCLLSHRAYCYLNTTVISSE